MGKAADELEVTVGSESLGHARSRQVLVTLGEALVENMAFSVLDINSVVRIVKRADGSELASFGGIQDKDVLADLLRRMSTDLELLDTQAFLDKYRPGPSRVLHEAISAATERLRRKRKP